MSIVDGALVGGLDLRPWAGTEVLDFDGALPVGLPDWTDDGGLFFDLIDGLNGRGRAISLPQEILAGWPGAAAGTIGAYRHPATDVLVIEAPDHDITLQPSVDNEAFGFPAAGLGPARTLVATNLPDAGFATSTGLTITPAGFPAYSVAVDTWVDTLTIQMRHRGIGDVDDTDSDSEDSLEALLHGQVDATVRMGIDADGHVVIAYPTSFAGVNWLETDFRDELGFTGLEVADVEGTVAMLRADRQHRSAAVLREGWDLDRGVFMPGTAVDDLAGDIASNNLGRFDRIRLRFQVTGPGHARNDHLHWLIRVRPGKGEPLSFYPRGLTETRRARDPYDVTVDAPAHSLTHTTIDQGYGGRFPARLHAEASDDEAVSFQSGAAIRSTPVEVLLSVRSAL